MRKEGRNSIWRSRDTNVLLTEKSRMIRNPTRNKYVAKFTMRWPRIKRRNKKKNTPKSSWRRRCTISREKSVNAMRKNILSIYESMIIQNTPTLRWKFLNTWRQRILKSTLVPLG
jgi:hypothetical protein